MARTNIGPFAQIGFAEDNGACFPQLSCHAGILRRFRAQQCERSSCGLHRVSGINIVFDQHRDSLQRTANALFFALSVERFRNRERVRIWFDHAVYDRAALIHFLDTVKIGFGERVGRELARFHPLLKIQNRGLVELKGLCRRNIRN